MAASSAAPVRSPEIRPRSRSRAGRDAGSSDADDLRTPRTLGRSRESPNAELLATAAATLAAQRNFRIEQLLELGTSSPDPAIGPGRAEVHVALRDAARSALRDIDAGPAQEARQLWALPELRRAMYIDRLRDLPMAPQCGRCQRVTHKDAQRRADEMVPMVGAAREVAHRGRGDVRPGAETAATAVRRRRWSDGQPASRRSSRLRRDGPRSCGGLVRRASGGRHAAATHTSRRRSSPFSTGTGICSTCWRAEQRSGTRAGQCWLSRAVPAVRGCGTNSAHSQGTGLEAVLPVRSSGGPAVE
jgi:hypothetical protein